MRSNPRRAGLSASQLNKQTGPRAVGGGFAAFEQNQPPVLRIPYHLQPIIHQRIIDNMLRDERVSEGQVNNFLLF
jgi:hypothetical protein